MRGLIYGLIAGQLLLLPIVQSALQPSPSKLFPSSHYYEPTVILSLQCVSHPTSELSLIFTV